MSIRTVSFLGFLILVILVSGVVALLGVSGIERSVVHEAQQRTNQDLRTLQTIYQQRLELLASRVQSQTADFTAVAAADRSGFLAQLRRELDLTVLNACDAEGQPLAGSYPEFDGRVPIAADPILRRALAGKLEWGTVLLDENRLAFEGGPALRQAVTLSTGESPASRGRSEALFMWVARPIFDGQKRVIGLLYGGRAINYNFALVDQLRNLLFGGDLYGGKPRGTVTFFLKDQRAATNVLREDGQRAMGTFVADEVRRQVLDKGGVWRDRAWVIDAWYLSGYQPLSDPDGKIVGMTYVGMLEAPYTDLKKLLLWRFLGPLGLVFLAALLLGTLFLNRLLAPLAKLGRQAVLIAEGHWDEPVKPARTFRELRQLSRLFERMRQAIVQRDRQLQDQNRRLGENNEELQKANRNYMETLAFVTHELRSPLAANQGLIDVMMQGLTGEVPPQVKQLLVRIKRNSEELLDMVKNYLDLARVERGELNSNPADIEICREVIQPCLDLSGPLFESRNITLETQCVEKLHLKADPDLLRIALSNYLTNAAKYGREGGRAVVRAQEKDGQLIFTVWNEGDGFTPEEGKQLFGKFIRLRNDTTHGKRGSGLGLFLSRQIVELHGGKVWAKSAPGQWAEFGFSFPITGFTDGAEAAAVPATPPATNGSA